MTFDPDATRCRSCGDTLTEDGECPFCKACEREGVE